LKKRVLITNQIPPVAFHFLSRYYTVTWNRKPVNESRLASIVKPFHALLTTLADPVSKKVLEAAPELKCVANYAVGFNNIDLETAKKRRIWVTNTPEVLTEATADIVWALLLACARRVPEGERLVRKGKFKGWHPLMLLGLDLSGKTLGLYGFGSIGQAVARRGSGWNMKIIYHQRHRIPVASENSLNAEYVSFENLLKHSDILSVNAPLTPQTHHRFTSREFGKMKRTAVFINTARGPIHDEAALVKALKKGIINSAGLDVYEYEPLINSTLLHLDNCTLLPHLGSGTVETRNKMATLAAQNIHLVLSGHKPHTPVFSTFSTPAKN
jgi:glyoxylate reductase